MHHGFAHRISSKNTSFRTTSKSFTSLTFFDITWQWQRNALCILFSSNLTLGWVSIFFFFKSQKESKKNLSSFLLRYQEKMLTSKKWWFWCCIASPQKTHLMDRDWQLLHDWHFLQNPQKDGGCHFSACGGIVWGDSQFHPNFFGKQCLFINCLQNYLFLIIIIN